MAKRKGKKSEWFNNIARLIKKKDGGYFLVFGRPTDKNGKRLKMDHPFPLTIKEGMIMNAQLTSDRLEYLVDNDLLDAKSAKQIAAREKFQFSMPKDSDRDEDEDEDLEEEEDEAPAKKPAKKSKPKSKPKEDEEDESEDEEEEAEDKDDEEDSDDDEEKDSEDEEEEEDGDF